MSRHKRLNFEEDCPTSQIWRAVKQCHDELVAYLMKDAKKRTVDDVVDGLAEWSELKPIALENLKTMNPFVRYKDGRAYVHVKPRSPNWKTEGDDWWEYTYFLHQTGSPNAYELETFQFGDPETV